MKKLVHNQKPRNPELALTLNKEYEANIFFDKNGKEVASLEESNSVEIRNDKGNLATYKSSLFSIIDARPTPNTKLEELLNNISSHLVVERCSGDDEMLKITLNSCDLVKNNPTVFYINNTDNCGLHVLEGIESYLSFIKRILNAYSNIIVSEEDQQRVILAIISATNFDKLDNYQSGAYYILSSYSLKQMQDNINKMTSFVDQAVAQEKLEIRRILYDYLTKIGTSIPHTVSSSSGNGLAIFVLTNYNKNIS